jgi:putative ABC transport system permease protein
MELVMRHAVTLVAIGVAVGLLLAAAAGRGLAAHLFGVTAYDPLTYVAVALATTLVALLASAVPAYRATRLDPNELLRAK